MSKVVISIVLASLLIACSCNPFSKFTDLASRVKDLPQFGQKISQDIFNKAIQRTESASDKAKYLFNKIKDEVENQASKVKNELEKSTQKINQIEHDIEKTIKEIRNKVLDNISNAFKKMGDSNQFLNALKEFKQLSGKEYIPIPSQQPTETTTEKDQNSNKSPNEQSPIEQKSETPKNPSEITSEDVQQINQNRGAGVVDNDLRTLVAKLSQNDIRTQLIEGFFEQPDTNLEKCRPVYKELSSFVPLLVQLMSSSSNQESIYLALNSKIRFDKVFGKIDSNSQVQICFNIESSTIKSTLLKLLLFNDEFLENSATNLEMWSYLSDAMQKFNLGGFISSGSSLASACKEASTVKISVDDKVLAKINFWACANAVLKTKQSGPISSNLVDDWKRAAVDATSFCLQSAN